FISENPSGPRVQTMIAVKAGSKFDPPTTTGLAHYLEHMLFKGSADFGTIDWNKEKILLDSISHLFEVHKNTSNNLEKKAIYKRIDSFSYEASKYAVPNEYDKMTTSLGAQGTNAFTSNDMTVYVNDIPTNALSKWLMLEANRFRTLVLRLFHTELEAVYEEFNINQDRDIRWSYQNVLATLYPNHPYGTQTTIGTGEHLKNPSMVNIHQYFRNYYCPNNIAIILAGDLDAATVVKEIEKHFGDWQPCKVPEFKKLPLPPLDKPVENEIRGPQPEHVILGFRFDGAGSREALMVSLLDEVLTNGQAGLIDLNVVQKQRALKAYSFVDENKDFTTHFFYGEPRSGQSLEELKEILLDEIEKVKKGEFEDWLLEAIIQNRKLRLMKDAEKNYNRANLMMDAFVNDIPWPKKINELEEMSKISKEDLIAFAQKYYNNYAVCYKRLGEPDRHKVEKPAITPVVMNKDTQSSFKRNFDTIPILPLKPVFLDYKKDIKRLSLSRDIPLFYIQNKLNKTFSLHYIFDMGSDNIRLLGLAVDYLKFLGTDKYSAEELQKEFYKMGLSFDVNTSRERVYVTLSGLEEHLEKGIKLLEHLLANAQPDKEAYEDLVNNILQARVNAKLNKGQILNSAMASYAKYGPKNPFNNIIKEEELRNINPTQLTELIRSLLKYKHKIFYYGQLDAKTVKELLSKYHLTKDKLLPYPPAVQYEEIENKERIVYFCHYNMKQAEVRMIAKDQKFNPALFTPQALYSEYYGGGLSSILFQEIREKMALAYSVFSYFEIPRYANRSHFIHAYVGTQSDKLPTAIVEMNRLLSDIPYVPQQFEGAKQNILKTIESQRYIGEDIFWNYDEATKLGLKEDRRIKIYQQVKNADFDILKNFFNNHIKNKNFTYCVLGNRENINFKELEKFGKVKELTLEELFGY
ncbi:MAG: insulinase family protein, partial [Chitinophagales bacterium]|nr:insulinase family protein [Chitinophagales bacterium]MDW8274486.1 insulinase family protein [Chitinophagales bacterium]